MSNDLERKKNSENQMEKKQTERSLNEVKILLVGDGGAGKTSLVKRLLQNTFNENESQTHGININKQSIQLEDRTITTRIWDFGGQEIMHATHQFFLSLRSLYILLLDGRKDEKTSYWLKHCLAFGGDSPVLVVLNKIDENPGFEVNRKHWKEKYPNIVGFHRISCKDGSGIAEFTATLHRTLAGMEMIATTWPESWFLVKEELETMTEPYISLNHYTDICVKHGVTDTGHQNTLKDFLNDLGLAIHFDELYLEDTHVLNPQWVTGAVYKILTAPQTAHDGGLVQLKNLGQLLKPQNKGDFTYKTDKHGFLIQLMNRFEICYPLEGNKEILIPDLLPVEEPEFYFDEEGALRFLLKYDFLPPSVMSRFLVRMHADIKESCRWRTGALLENEEFNALAVVKADKDDKVIRLYITGPQRREYLLILLHQLRSINSSFEKLLVSEEISLPDNPELTVPYSHLLKLEHMGMDSYLPIGADREYKIKELLGFVDKNDSDQLLRELNEEYEVMKKIEDPRKRGFQLEDFLYRLFDFFQMKPHKSFRNPGEQIDGSFQVGSDVYLLEAKWNDTGVGAKDLLYFAGLLERRPKGTFGLFISINGFTKEAIASFRTTRSAPFLAMDSADLEIVLSGNITLPEAIELKKRRLAETNDFFAPLEQLLKPDTITMPIVESVPPEITHKPVKTINITGTCIPGLHYMADTSRIINNILPMVEAGEYFTINRPRQYGKTTTIYLLDQKLKREQDYLSMKISFEGIDAPTYGKQEEFLKIFISLLKDNLKKSGEDLPSQLMDEYGKNVTNMPQLSEFISLFVGSTGLKVVLIIDEVDKSSNNQLFLDFLGMLRTKYLNRKEGNEYTFHSVVLAGVHDVKTLKAKIRGDEDEKLNSPWNIAVDFTVDLRLTQTEITTMLEDISNGENIDIDIPFFSERIFYYTAGHPFLVSKLCKIIHEGDTAKEKKDRWRSEDLEPAVQDILNEGNTNFDSLIKNLENNPKLYDHVFKIVMNQKDFSFNRDNPIIHYGNTYGILREENRKAVIHNRIYAQRIYNYMTSKLESSPDINFSAITSHYLNPDGSLNMERVIKKFQQFMKEQYGKKDADFLERNGTLLFLAFLKPIINGSGYDFKEPQISEERRIDVAVTFKEHRYIIELKIWSGAKYHEAGIAQLSEYLDTLNMSKGYLLIYDKRKEKGQTEKSETITVNGKKIFMAWV